MATKWGANAMEKNQKGQNLIGFEYDEQNQLVMGTMLSKKTGVVDLIQNCDLPPPMKVFTSVDHKTMINSMEKKRSDGFKQEFLDDGNGNGKLELLKALRLSQTRARKAEEKYWVMCKEKNDVYYWLMEDSIRLFGYKQLVRLLEFHVHNLEYENKIKKSRKYGNGDGDDDENCGLTWIMALALCFGVVGFGYAFGYKCFWF